MTSLLAELLADTDGWGTHMGWGGGWWMAVWGTLMMGGFVVLVAWLVRTPSGGGHAQHPTEDPLAAARRILAERYARGEMSTDEYREHLRELASPS